MRSGRFCLAILVGLVICLFSSCASGAAPVDMAEMEALGNTFVEELNGVIPLREDADALLALGDLTVIGDKTYHLAALDAFYEEYRVGGEAELTVIYQTSGFVVIKVVFSGAAGYYYRYEIDPADVKAINIEAEPVSEVSIEERVTGDLRSVDVTISRPEASSLVLTFDNIMDEGGEVQE